MNRCFLLIVSIFFICFTTIAQELAIHKPESETQQVVANSTTTTGDAKPIALSEVANYVGKTVRVCGKVYSAKLLKNIIGQTTLMNLGGAYANERVEIRISFSSLPNFAYNPAKIFLDKNVCITGLISNLHGFNEIAIDTLSARRLINQAMSEEADTAISKIARLKLSTNAYLFAGPGLNQPIITHLKAGSVVMPEYSDAGYTYVKIIEKVGAPEIPTWLYGFMPLLVFPQRRRCMVFFTCNLCVGEANT